MIEAFPYQPSNTFLEYEDFSGLDSAFRKAVQKAIPGSGPVYFIWNRSVPASFRDQQERFDSLELALNRIFHDGVLVSVIDHGLLFAFSVQDDRRLVVFVDEVDELIISRAAEDWLLETREQLVLEFLECKRRFIDPETGLLNCTHLFEELSSRESEKKRSLILVQLLARTRGVRDTFRSAQKAAAALRSFSGERLQLYHLGQNVYAFLSYSNGLQNLDNFSSSLVHYLKRENFYRVHVGSSRRVAGGGGSDFGKADWESAGRFDELLNEAWTALQEAAKRGPFSFCDFSLLANADQHPLRPHRRDILMPYRKISSKEATFAIIKLNLPQSDIMGAEIKSLESVLTSIGSDGGGGIQLLGIDRGALLFAPGVSGSGGVELARQLIEKVRLSEPFSNVYAGVSSYPYLDFSASDILQNAQKALLHAEFFGPGHAVLFDAVSLNISGDIYFGDGNLPKAIKEYRLGLRSDPKSVNLLNSLGVTYALMNRDTPARNAFQKVLDIDSSNYMAHYNLGLSAQQRGDAGLALHHFSAAHCLCEKAGQQQEICCDLRLQLGKLCCQVGEYEKAIHYLNFWKESMPESEGERALRFLGEAYLGTGDYKMALPVLQKALGQNPFDAEVMSMLGEAVWLAAEGNDIALSLCQKATELEPGDARLRLRLARVQYHLGDSERMLENLKKCRGRLVNPIEVQLLKSMAYAGLNQNGRARSWAEKVLAQSGRGGEFYTKAESVIASL